MENVQNRKRYIDVNKLTQEEAESISEQIGQKVREYCDEACEKSNKILNIYGMKAQMQIVIEPTEQKLQKPVREKGKKKRDPIK